MNKNWHYPSSASSLVMQHVLDDFWNTQRNYVNLVASACYPYREVMELQSVPLQILPIEGLPGNRYFPAYECMDDIEVEAERLILRLFPDTENYRASIQPHSGTQANQIVYNAVLSDDDTVLSMDPNSGGHISHTKLAGRKVKVIHYGLTIDGQIDYEGLRYLANIHHPKLIIAGASSYPREINYASISEIAHSVNAMLHADICHTALYVLSGHHANIFPYADFVSFTMDKNLRGPQGGILIYRQDFHRKIKQSIFPISQGGPLQSLMLAKLCCLERLLYDDIRSYAHNVICNAQILCKALSFNGLDIITNGTDTHIITLDLSNSPQNGAEAELDCFVNKILVNKNLVPNDQGSALTPSGIRLGSTCITLLEYSEHEVEEIGKVIAKIVMKSASSIDMRCIQEIIHNHPFLP